MKRSRFVQPEFVPLIVEIQSLGLERFADRIRRITGYEQIDVDRVPAVAVKKARQCPLEARH